MGICERCGATANSTTCPLCGSTKIIPSGLPPAPVTPPVWVSLPAAPFTPPDPSISPAVQLPDPGNRSSNGQPRSKIPGVDKKRLLVLGGVATFAILAVTFALNGFGANDGSQQSGPTQPAANAVAPVATPEVAVTAEAAESSPAADSIAQAPRLSSCWEIDADAAALATYAASLGSAAANPAAISELNSSFTEMEGSCGVVYASDVAHSLSRQPGISPAVQEAAASYAAAQIRFPAPAGSSVQQWIDSPQRNISCELEESSVGCSILERQYSVEEDCPDRLFSATLFNGEAETACGTEWLGQVGDDFYHISYGETVTFGFAACTIEADGPRRGMTCWDTRTGRSFLLSRARFEIDNTL